MLWLRSWLNDLFHDLFFLLLKMVGHWQPTSVLLPGKSHGRRSLVDCSPWGRMRLSDFTFTFHFRALEKEMATYSSVLAWRIPGTGEPGGLPSMGSHRVGHDWSDLTAAVLKPAVIYLESFESLASSQGATVVRIIGIHVIISIFHMKTWKLKRTQEMSQKSYSPEATKPEFPSVSIWF